MIYMHIRTYNITMYFPCWSEDSVSRNPLQLHEAGAVPTTRPGPWSVACKVVPHKLAKLVCNLY